MIGYLEAQPAARLPRFSTKDEAVATVAVCLRWGSYFALPADRGRPLWEEARNPRVSLIADAEMKRINIEASSALERWLEVWRSDRERWHQLVARAVRYLPMETRNVRRDQETMLAALSNPELASQILPLVGPARTAERREQAQAHPTRVLANAIVNRSFRNGPVEGLHAGTRTVGPPLGMCRLTLRDCRSVLRGALGGVADAMWGLMGFDGDPERRPWEEQVLPYHVVDSVLITPSGWSLTDRTCPVALAGSEAESRLPVATDG